MLINVILTSAMTVLSRRPSLNDCGEKIYFNHEDEIYPYIKGTRPKLQELWKAC